MSDRREHTPDPGGLAVAGGAVAAVVSFVLFVEAYARGAFLMDVGAAGIAGVAVPVAVGFAVMGWLAGWSLPGRDGPGVGGPS